MRPGDLLLTTGARLPAEGEAQRLWVSTLADVGISGLVLAARPGAPQPTQAMLAVADERVVPLITGDFAVKFSSLIRTVCESVVQSERDHINVARRLFDVYSGALRSRADLSGRLEAVAGSIGWSISVTRRGEGSVVAGGGRPEGDNTEPITVPVPGRPGVDVVVRPDRQRVLDGSLHPTLPSIGKVCEAKSADGARCRRRNGMTTSWW